MTLSAQPEQFWNFSLKLYRQPGVESLCLKLQQDGQADINILLWLCWLETKSIPVDHKQIQQAEAHIARWNQEAVWPLRALRTEMKQRYGTSDVAIEATRSAIKKAELQAERVVQIRLEQLADTWPAPSQHQALQAGHNLAIYAEYLHLPEPLKRKMQILYESVEGLSSVPGGEK